MLLLAPAAQARERGLSRLERDTREHLKAMVPLDTTNPPGNEIIVARYIDGKLRDAGIESEIYTSSGTRSSVIARLRGSGAKPPLVLMCHTDVVPADPKEWETPPFEAVEKDGYLYGRGTTDNKSMCAAGLAVLVSLKREGVKLSRDLVLFAQADEESGASYRHIDWLLAKHGDLLNAKFALNEGGNTVWENGKVAEIRIQAAEKEFMDVVLTARGRAGHSSVPRSDNALATLSRAVTRVFEHRFAARLDEVVRTFLQRQQEGAEPELRGAIAEALAVDGQEDLDRAADRLAAVNPEFGAMLRDTITPTMLKAGYKSNVIPAEAEATLNARLLPGRDPEEFIAELKAVIDEPAIEVSFVAPAGPPVGAMPIDTTLYQAARDAAAELAPGARVMPFMAAWTTDAKSLRQRGTIVYGIEPPLSADDGERVHGKNERISLAALDWYARYLKAVVLRVAALDGSAKGNAR